MTFNKLNKEQRDVIQFMLDKKYNFSQIGKSINKDRTTISKEIKRNRYIRVVRKLQISSFKIINSTN